MYWAMLRSQKNWHPLLLKKPSEFESLGILCSFPIMTLTEAYVCYYSASTHRHDEGHFSASVASRSLSSPIGAPQRHLQLVANLTFLASKMLPEWTKYFSWLELISGRTCSEFEKLSKEFNLWFVPCINSFENTTSATIIYLFQEALFISEKKIW